MASPKLSIPVCDGVREPQDCKCYGAVMRTFTALQDEPHHIALEAACRVYCYHHPNDNKRDAYLTVQRWVSAEQIH